MINYKATFSAIERTVSSEASHSSKQLQKAFDPYRKLHDKKHTDDQYWIILVGVVFYSGFRAATVTERRKAIDHAFADFSAVAKFDEAKINQLQKDRSIVRNERKIVACVYNAKQFEEIVSSYGSVAKYLASFQPQESFENLFLLKEDLEARFKFIGPTTVYHFLMETGQSVWKPDRVIMRLLKRLGIIGGRGGILEAVIHGRRFADAVGQPIRYVDIVLSAFGQVSSNQFGLKRGICLEGNPRCSVCKANRHCRYFREHTPSP